MRGRLSARVTGPLYLWDHGAAINLGTLPGTVLSVPTGINNRGQIVGTSDGRAWVWQDGVMTELPGLSGPVDINNAGQIVGVAGGHAVLWEDGAMTVLNLPAGQVSTVAINDLGHVAATVSSVGVVWRNGEVLTLPPPAPGQPVQVRDINSRGDVVGESGALSSTNLLLAMLWVAPAEEWTFCASEGDVCAFTGTTEVRYGANGSFVFKTLTDGTACTNDVFGDPIYGTVKECATRSTPPTTDWTFCANEGDNCAFTGTMAVRYGASGAFFFQTLTDGTACTKRRVR